MYCSNDTKRRALSLQDTAELLVMYCTAYSGSRQTGMLVADNGRSKAINAHRRTVSVGLTAGQRSAT